MCGFFGRFPGSGYICAHRGARSLAPENTLWALEQARLRGADLAEIDVRICAGMELVVCHDASPLRTSDLPTREDLWERRGAPLTTFSATELRSLDAGSWFLSDDPFGTVAAGEVREADFPRIREQKIPLLSEILERACRWRFPLNLEIKDHAGTVADDLIVSLVLDKVRLAGAESLVLISSFRHDYLQAAKHLHPAIATAALVEHRHPAELLDYLSRLRVDAYHPAQQITDTDLIRRLVKVGLRVNSWTLNEAEKIISFGQAGATFLCTDWPQRFARREHSP